MRVLARVCAVFASPDPAFQVLLYGCDRLMLNGRWLQSTQGQIATLLLVFPAVQRKHLVRPQPLVFAIHRHTVSRDAPNSRIIAAIGILSLYMRHAASDFFRNSSVA